MMNIWSQNSKRAPQITLAVLVCFGVLMTYMVSERQQIVYFLPEGRLNDQRGDRSDSDKTTSALKQSTTHATGDNENGAVLSSSPVTSSVSYSSSLTSSLLTEKRLSPSMTDSAASVSERKSAETSGLNYNSGTAPTDRQESSHLKNHKNVAMSLPRNKSNTTGTLLDFKVVRKLENINAREIYEMSLNGTDQHFDSYSELQRARIHRVKETCATSNFFKNRMYTGLTKTVIYQSQNYNFSFCKVPKSGSTFWTRVFGVLKFGLKYAEFVFKKSRRSVHGTMGQYASSLLKTIRYQSRTILVSRCPYSRLFSAFIDKSFLQLQSRLNYLIRNISLVDIGTSTCQSNATFQEFLDWIILEVKRGNILDRHWAPIISLCRPCKINTFILVKQETFARDVEFALQELGVEKIKYDYITNALHDHRAELSLPGILSTLFEHFASPVVKKCLTFLEYAKRIWTSLKIQGYIDESLEFPLEIDQNQFSNRTYFTEIVLKVIKEYPLSSSHSKAQRKQYLYQAYKSIKPETIQGIQELYKQDFELFGYSKIPPAEYELQVDPHD